MQADCETCFGTLLDYYVARLDGQANGDAMGENPCLVPDDADGMLGTYSFCPRTCACHTLGGKVREQGATPM